MTEKLLTGTLSLNTTNQLSIKQSCISIASQSYNSTYTPSARQYISIYIEMTVQTPKTDEIKGSRDLSRIQTLLSNFFVLFTLTHHTVHAVLTKQKTFGL